MSDESKTPNDPNTAKNNSEASSDGSSSSSQIDIANELNRVLLDVSSKLEKINQLTKNQADFVLSMTQSFQEIKENVDEISQSSESVSENLIDASSKVIDTINPEGINKISQSLTQVSNAASKGLTSHSKGLSDLSDGMLSASKKVSKTGSEMINVNKGIEKVSKKVSDDMLTFRKNTQDMVGKTNSFAEALIKLGDKLKNLMSGIAGTIKNVVKGGFAIVKGLFNAITSLVGAATQLLKFSLTLPFTITKKAVEVGNIIRTELVETIQQAGEDLKENFDFDSSIGQGVQQMTARGKNMLIAFQSPSHELVKLFGMGSAGIANMIKEVGGNIAAMGHFSEIFGKSIMGNERRTKNFTKMVRAFGFSAEEIHYMALDASNNMEHINTRMAKLGVVLSTVSTEYQVDRKRLAKNFMILRKDITQFGHLSDEEIAKTTANLTHMRVKLEDAAAVFKKFSTFEDAANSVAILSQTFGMNLDAFDMIQAKNPEEIINMFRNSMLETGRAFEDLNRFEKDLMAQHTGMSAESLSALMNYRDLGLTHEEAVRRMASERPEAKQMAALKDLNSAIKEVQKVMTFDSPFVAFGKGLAANTSMSGELKDVMVSLSQGYEGIYEYARSLDPKTWSGLIKPINHVIRIMQGILKSDGFKEGLVNSVEVIAGFVGQLFDFDTPAKQLANNATTLANQGKNLADGLEKGVISKNEENVGNLVSLSGRIMGAIIKGAGVGLVALLKVSTKGIDKLETLMKKSDPHKNFIESFFGWDAGEVVKMGDQLRNAAVDFFNNSSGIISITGWLLDGFKDIFKIAIGLFGGFLAAGIDEIFGTQFSAKPKISLAQTAVKSQRKPSSETLSEISDTLTKEETVNRNTLASMIHDLSDKASTVKDPGQKKRLEGAIQSLKTKFTEEGNSEDDFRNIALQTATVMQGISQGKYIGRDLSTIGQINAQDTSTIGTLPGEVGAVIGGGLAGGLATGMIAMPTAVASLLPFLGAIPGVNVVTGSLLGAAAMSYAGYKVFQGLSEMLTAEEPDSIKTAKKFDEYMENKLASKIIPKLASGSKFSSKFNNIYFRSFWANYGEEISKAAGMSKKDKVNAISPAHEVGKFTQSPYYQKVFKNNLHGDMMSAKKQQELMLDKKPAGEGKEFVKEGKVVKDLEFLNKYVNVSESKNILNNLLDSVSLPRAFGDESTAIPSSKYSGSSEIKSNKRNTFTKQKVKEIQDKFENLGSEIENKKIEVDADFIFESDVVDTLMKTMAKRNLVRILGMPEFTNGVMNLVESAIGSRCFNVGSDGTAPTTEVIQPSS